MQGRRIWLTALHCVEDRHQSFTYFDVAAALVNVAMFIFSKIIDIHHEIQLCLSFLYILSFLFLYSQYLHHNSKKVLVDQPGNLKIHIGIYFVFF